MNVIYQLLGIYSRFYIVSSLEVITLFGYFVALTWYKKKRKFYVLRLIVSFVVGMLLCIPLSILRTHFDNIYTHIFSYSAILLFIFLWFIFCYREKPNEIFLCFSGIVAAKSFSGHVFSLLLNIAGVDDLVSMSFFSDVNPTIDWIIYFTLHATLLFGIYLFLRKQENLQENMMTEHAVTLAIITLLLAGVLSTVTRNFQSESFALAVCIKIFQLVCYAFILLLRSNILNHSKISKELQITEQLLKQEKKRYAEIKDNIDIVNMKCHDIKRQLTNFQGKLTNEEIETLKDAIKIYDSNIKTGSTVLDTVLYQKQLYCEKNAVILKFIVDGEAISFMSGSDLYALVSNALDNAIEAVGKLTPDKRIVDLSIKKEKKTVRIEVVNYFNQSSEIVAGTSKEDKIHHGYGIKSMEYIVSQYKGELHTETENNIFYLTAIIPCS